MPATTPIEKYNMKIFLTKKLIKKPNDAITAPIIVVILHPYLFVKIDAIGPLNKVTAGNNE